MAAAAALAGPAEAASQATFTNLVEGSNATIRGDGRELRAGLMGMTIDGKATSGYCIDLGTEIAPGASGLDEVEWESSLVTNLDVVGSILAAYHPNGVGPAAFAITGTDAQKAAATQAAIWHFTDSFELTVGSNDPVIEANYRAILDAVAADALGSSGQPDVSLSITPPASTEAPAGGLVGPFVVSTTADVVTLTTSTGVTVTDADGQPLAGPIGNGSEFFLLGDAETTATVTASADANVKAGRVFVKKGIQRLILAESVEALVKVDISASWTAPPPTTVPPTTTPPTTAPPTTAPPTTVPETTTTVPQSSTTAPPQTSTTVAIEPNPSVVPTTAPTAAPTTAGDGESLPRTGSDTRPLVAVGIALVAAGAVFGVAARRRRT